MVSGGRSSGRAWPSSREGGGWRGSGLLEDALLLLVHVGPVRNGFSSVEGDHVSLELDPLVCGGSGWLKSILSAPKPIIIERACARVPLKFKVLLVI